MSDLDLRHIDAVAAVITEAWHRGDSDVEAILTSTDPGLLDAMQRALVRAGRLTEDDEWDEDLDGFGEVIRATYRRRYVTDWQEADQ